MAKPRQKSKRIEAPSFKVKLFVFVFGAGLLILLFQNASTSSSPCSPNVDSCVVAPMPPPQSTLPPGPGGWGPPAELPRDDGFLHGSPGDGCFDALRVSSGGAGAMAGSFSLCDEDSGGGGDPPVYADEYCKKMASEDPNQHVNELWEAWGLARMILAQNHACREFLGAPPSIVNTVIESYGGDLEAVTGAFGPNPATWPPEVNNSHKRDPLPMLDSVDIIIMRPGMDDDSIGSDGRPFLDCDRRVGVRAAVNSNGDGRGSIKVYPPFFVAPSQDNTLARARTLLHEVGHMTRPHRHVYYNVPPLEAIKSSTIYDSLIVKICDLEKYR